MLASWRIGVPTPAKECLSFKVCLDCLSRPSPKIRSKKRTGMKLSKRAPSPGLGFSSQCHKMSKSITYNTFKWKPRTEPLLGKFWVFFSLSPYHSWISHWGLGQWYSDGHKPAPRVDPPLETGVVYQGNSLFCYQEKGNVCDKQQV